LCTKKQNALSSLTQQQQQQQQQSCYTIRVIHHNFKHLAFTALSLIKMQCDLAL
jgi:hypothetical protein